MTVAETGIVATFTVTLNRPTDQTVSVVYATRDGTAKAGSDYTHIVGRLKIPAGSRSGRIRVPVLDDSEGEGDEHFTVMLVDPVYATIARGKGRATIRDDERPPVSVSWGAPSYAVAEGKSVEVTVILSEPPGRPVTIQLTHTPRGGADETDYSGVPGSVRFDAHETQKTFDVLAEEDEAQDHGERVVLGFGTTLPDGVTPTAPETSAVNIDDGPRSTRRAANDWLRRFSDAATGHALDAIGERIRCTADRPSLFVTPDDAGLGLRCGPQSGGPVSFVLDGRRLDGSILSADSSLPIWSALPPYHELMTDGWTSAQRPVLELRSPTASEVLFGSSFNISSEVQEGTPALSFWGRGSFSRIDDREDGTDLDGEVGSATFGVDFAHEDMLAGVAFSRSEGDGTASTDGVERKVASSLTGLYPYLRLSLDDHVALWGAMGFGSGTLTDSVKDAEPNRVGVAVRMAVVGVQSAILFPTRHKPFSLTLKSDALFLRGSSDDSPAAALHAETNRLRALLEGGYDYKFDDGAWVSPFVEVGLRRDAGDAESGVEVEMGGGFRYTHPALGWTAGLDAHGVLSRDADDFSEWGVSGSLHYRPHARSEAGPYLAFSSSLGTVGLSRSDAPWRSRAISDSTAGNNAVPDASLDAEFGYGLPVMRSSGTGTPWVGMSWSESRRDLRLGYRLGFGASVRLGLEGALRHSATGEVPSDRAVMLRLSLN